MNRKSDFEKRADRAAQDILNLYAQVCIELGGWSLPPKFAYKFSKNKLSALIQTRMMEPGRAPTLRGESLKAEGG